MASDPNRSFALAVPSVSSLLAHCTLREAPMVKRFGIMLFASALCTSCSYSFGVELSEEHGKLRFDFHDCGRFFRETVQVQNVTFWNYDATSGRVGSSVCEFNISPTSSWEYDLKVGSCAGFVPGKSYYVWARFPGHNASRKFRLETRGALPLEPACR